MRRFKKFSFAMLAVYSLLCTSAYAASYAWSFTLDTGESMVETSPKVPTRFGLELDATLTMQQ